MFVPAFTLAGYHELLVRLSVDCGYALRPASRENLARAYKTKDRTVLLRHDIDLHLRSCEAVAEVEESFGPYVRSAWFVRPDGAYNPALASNRRILRRLHEAGHVVGLHYDVSLLQKGHTILQHNLLIERQRSLLKQQLGGVSITAIAPHRPTGPHEDTVRSHPDHVLPRIDESLVYVSDSCRRWRSDVPVTIDRLLRNESRALFPIVQLNTHPEWWDSSTERDRYTHIATFTRQDAEADAREMIDDELAAWESHPGVSLPAVTPDA